LPQISVDSVGSPETDIRVGFRLQVALTLEAIALNCSHAWELLPSREIRFLLELHDAPSSKTVPMAQTLLEEDFPK